MTQKVSRVTNKKDDHGERELATVSRNNTLQDITMKQTHSPFTLIELLVVIAIIGILASLLLPSLSMARAKGKATQCSGNMRSFSQRMLMYADDYKDYFMPWDIKMNSWAGGYPESRWHNVLDGSANPVVVIFSSEKRLFFKMLTCPGCNIPRTSAGSYYAQHYGYNLSNNGIRTCIRFLAVLQRID